MAVIQFPFCHSPIGNLKIFTKFLAIHASAFPQFFYFGFAVHFIYPIKQKYTLRRTVTEWELDNRHAPEYVLRLLEYYIQNEGLAKKKVTDECSEMEERGGLHEKN